MSVVSAHRVAIIGSGIVGLAHAWAASLRGDAVTVYERDTQAVGASVRNFGLGLVLGQPQGELYDMALRSRAMWLEFFRDTDCWHKAQGSLTVARTPAELAVIEAFQQECGAAYGTKLMNAAEVATHHATGLGGLYSGTEIALESRYAMGILAKWLAVRHGVKFEYGVQVNAIELPKLHSSTGIHYADQVVICSGHDFQTLYPQHYANLGAGVGIKRCALQMLRVANPGIQLAPALMTGLSTLRYEAYTECKALAEPLAALRAEVERTAPALLEHDIHLIVQQVGARGDLLIGDSHVHSETVSPFSRTDIDALILGLAENLLGRSLSVLEHWQGVYASGPNAYELITPAEHVLGVVITGGTGMSISFALAQKNLT
ncbi:TIGR03364 family FAD-dependent oxidoreductase [Solimicrobium silvestre]|uniref:FAD dependent oxidoreductase TIGR03364 n=1 Tax=Solimicrobium silvestre TaxID=2099400 RepID=A0A2S9GYJ6_9BURK|nr:TIGR03364 family FAD-dependent oxidoreductase [Solimicrobium silvestre]PRC92778.1 FAD dependent oxidoreductase TIGR03364 [Solimicrobium silvestre]